jgi:uncharacterized protein (DUF1501 family)
MQRRDFLRGLGFLSASTALSQLGWINAKADGSDDASRDYRALVCLFLYGGNDGNNMIVPIDARYDTYAALRGPLALPADSLIKLQDVNGSTDLGLHPALSGLKNIWSSGHLAALLNSGPLLRPVTRADLIAGLSRPAGLFSHSDQQRSWQTASRSTESRGWGGRLSDELTASNAGAKAPGSFAITRAGAFSNAQSGSLVLPTSGGLALRGTDSSSASRARAAALDQMLIADKSFELVAAAQEVTAGVLERRAAVNGIINTASTTVKTAFNGLTSNLSKQLATVAKLIERHQDLGLRRQVFFVGLSGFDTHSGQLATQNGLFGQLGGALKAFYDATVAMGMADQVTAFTLSDFARTMRGNTVGGTDHAWGNHHLIVGGAVRGRTFYGELPQLVAGGPDDAGDEGRWIPTTSVDQYAATLARWFGVADDKLASVFPNLHNFTTQTLPIF